VKPNLTHRPATIEDAALLAELNHQLIRDEGHRNAMSLPELESRMREWIGGEYRAVIFEESGELVAYALFREKADHVYLRQLFVMRHRRCEGIGRAAVAILRSHVWPAGKRLTVDVLTANERAVAFWRSVGFTDYCLTLEIMPDPRHE
jgi:GNAT superfamily N-acetyltransferase